MSNKLKEIVEPQPFKTIGEAQNAKEKAEKVLNASKSSHTIAWISSAFSIIFIILMIKSPKWIDDTKFGMVVYLFLLIGSFILSMIAYITGGGFVSALKGAGSICIFGILIPFPFNLCLMWALFAAAIYFFFFFPIIILKINKDKMTTQLEKADEFIKRFAMPGLDENTDGIVSISQQEFNPNAPISQSQPVMRSNSFCKQCGSAIPEGRAFCSKCGAKVE